MKIVILTSNTPSNVWLVNQILARHEVAAIVIEARPLATDAREKRARRRRMLQRYGPWRTLNKLLYNVLRWRLLGPAESARLCDHFFPGNAAVSYSREVTGVTVANINDAECIELIKRLRPEAIAVCGTSLIRPELFTLAPRGTLNIHTGITPEYRSADPIFWALYDNAPDKVGVTIHFVDQGIDTGPIIFQESVPLYAGDDLAGIAARCIERGAALYIRALDDLERSAVRTVDRSAVKGKSFRSMDLGLVQYLVFLVRFKRLLRHRPRAPELEGGILRSR